MLSRAAQQFSARFGRDLDESRLRGSGFAEEVVRGGGDELCKDLAQTLRCVEVAIRAATDALTVTGVVAAAVSIQDEVDIVAIADRAVCTARSGVDPIVFCRPRSYHLINEAYPRGVEYKCRLVVGRLVSPSSIPDIYKRLLGAHSAVHGQAYAALGDPRCLIGGARFAIRGAGGLAGDAFHGLLAEPLPLRHGHADCGV